MVWFDDKFMFIECIFEHLWFFYCSSGNYHANMSDKRFFEKNVIYKFK